MIRFWMVRGHDPDKLAALSSVEKMTYTYMMEQCQLEENERLGAMFGSK